MGSEHYSSVSILPWKVGCRAIGKTWCLKERCDRSRGDELTMVQVLEFQGLERCMCDMGTRFYWTICFPIYIVDDLWQDNISPPFDLLCSCSDKGVRSHHLWGMLRSTQDQVLDLTVEWLYVSQTTCCLGLYTLAALSWWGYHVPTAAPRGRVKFPKSSTHILGICILKNKYFLLPDKTTYRVITAWSFIWLSRSDYSVTTKESNRL